MHIKRPPFLSTRRTSFKAGSVRVTLRRPNAGLVSCVAVLWFSFVCCSVAQAKCWFSLGFSSVGLFLCTVLGEGGGGERERARERERERERDRERDRNLW
jgi:hypothetical protein